MSLCSLCTNITIFSMLLMCVCEFMFVCRFVCVFVEWDELAVPVTVAIASLPLALSSPFAAAAAAGAEAGAEAGAIVGLADGYA
jgi:hypothetical protein